jgi:dihydrofolate synthase/folylpolyglutamate synthase
MVAWALKAAGYRVGLYTSPHLHRFNERMQIDGAPVRDAELAELIGAVRRHCPWHDEPDNEDRLTYFEFATVLALLWFARHEVDVAVVETGLGGHLDATAVLQPCVIAMISIGLDHREYLGASLTEVARAEASIFKPGVPVVVAPGQAPDVLSVLQAEAEQRHTSLSVCSSEYAGPLSLRGRHQRLNAALAKAVLEGLAPYGLTVAEDIVAAGLASTRWPGRLEEIDGVILEVAHNADGARALSRALVDCYPEQPVELVFGVMADKDYAEILLALSGVTRRVHLCPAVAPRSLDPTRCAPLAIDLGLPVSTYSTCANALAAAREAAGTVGRVCATGSFAVVAEVRRILLGDQVLADGEERWT